MAEQTEEDNGHRPLTSDERKSLRELIEKKEDILDVSTNFAHLGWLASAMLYIAKWVVGIVGAVVIWSSYKSGPGIK